MRISFRDRQLSASKFRQRVTDMRLSQRFIECLIKGRKYCRIDSYFVFCPFKQLVILPTTKSRILILNNNANNTSDPSVKAQKLQGSRESWVTFHTTKLFALYTRD